MPFRVAAECSIPATSQGHSPGSNIRRSCLRSVSGFGFRTPESRFDFNRWWSASHLVKLLIDCGRAWMVRNSLRNGLVGYSRRFSDAARNAKIRRVVVVNDQQRHLGVVNGCQLFPVAVRQPCKGGYNLTDTHDGVLLQPSRSPKSQHRS